MSGRPSSAANRAAGALGLALLLLAAGGAAAHAHLALRGSVPSAGERLSTVPDTIRLSYTEPVELALARVTLSGPLGAVELADPRHGVEPTTLLVPITGALVAGRHTVMWQAVGLDGHPVRGELEFEVEEDAEGLAPSEPTPGADAALPVQPVPPPPPPPPGPTFSAGHPLYAAVRWLTFLGILGTAGAVGFAQVVLRRLPASAAADPLPFATTASRAAAGVGAAAALLLLLALPLRLQAQAHAVFGRGISAEGFGALLRTGWGAAWAIQAIATLLALAGLLLARRGVRPGWILAAAAASVLAFTPALAGHAAAVGHLRALALLTDGIHVLAAGLWLGGLLLLATTGIPLALREAPPLRGGLVATLVNTFSPIALAGAGLVVATGVLSASFHLTAVADLWRSAYGQLLLLKLAFALVVFGTGALNWLRLRPRAQDPATAHLLRRSAAVELGAAVLVVAVTSVLVAQPPPAHAAPQPPVAAAHAPPPGP